MKNYESMMVKCLQWINFFEQIEGEENGDVLMLVKI